MSGSAPGIASSARISRSAPARAAWCRGDRLHVELVDGRVVEHQLPDFVEAAPADKRRCVVEGFGTAIWWPDLDEGVGVNWIFGVGEDVIYRFAGFTKGVSAG